jgi:hypothetical protein
LFTKPRNPGETRERERKEDEPIQRKEHRNTEPPCVVWDKTRMRMRKGRKVLQFKGKEEEYTLHCIK